MMKVLLAGYNIDVEAMRGLRQGRQEESDLTPETIAAAYARISRIPLAVSELRAAARADVAGARRSNRTIVFGMGHSSIAEHAVFNIDVLGISRLLVEDIEKFRLASYTEKSQRYVLLADDFVLPKEIVAAGLGAEFSAAVRRRQRFYHELYERLRDRNEDAGQGNSCDTEGRAGRVAREERAKEDARYCLPLAVTTQLGMTVNARTLELMIRRFAAHPLAEGRSYGRALYEATQGVAPSLIRYTEATDYDRRTRSALRGLAAALLAGQEAADFCPPVPVRLLEVTPSADERLVAVLLHAASTLPFSVCRERAARLGPREREELVMTSLRELRAYDPVLREFEHIQLLFELVVSASCFAQLKRHRMATMTCQDYDPTLGVTVPPAVREAGMAAPFAAMVAEAQDLYERIRHAARAAAPYALTNAHRRRVLLSLNARELYHMTRLRCDAHAQWDIRACVEAMLAAARAEMPLTLMLAGGKDRFPALHAALVKDER